MKPPGAEANFGFLRMRSGPSNQVGAEDENIALWRQINIAAPSHTNTQRAIQRSHVQDLNFTAMENARMVGIVI